MEPLEDRRMLSLTLFVDADAPDGGDGLGWSTAYNDLQAALEDAGARNADAVGENDVEAIWIAEGVYRPSAELETGDPRSASFSLVDGVTLYGGFEGAEAELSARDWIAHETVLSGEIGVVEDLYDNAYTVVYCGADIEAAVDGVAIVDGRATGYSSVSHPERRYGGGIYCSGTLTITNSTLSGNSAWGGYGGAGGGGIYSSGTLTIANSTLSGNSAGSGGGIDSAGTLTVTNSTLSGNSANRGGGIYNSGTLTVTDSTVAGNSAGSGGGIYSVGTLAVTDSTLVENWAEDGGGISNFGTLTVSNSTLSGNWAMEGWHHGGGGGGGISNFGTLTVINSTLSGNSANGGLDNGFGSGGGIFNFGTLTVTNSTFSGNSADDDGGGICNSGTLTVTNSTVSGNFAGEHGGGICGYGTLTVILDNTIVAGNAASFGPDISGTLSGSDNVIGDGSGQSSLVDGVGRNQIGTSASPIDPLLSHWTELDNGRWGYYLLPGSPALDAGENALAVDAAGQPLIEDISGSPRIQNGTVDIGAVEGATLGDPAQVYVVTSLEKTIAEDGVLTFLEAFEAANRNQPVGDAPAGSFTERDVIRFSEGLSGTVLVDDGELTIQGDLNIEGPGAELLTFDAGGVNSVFLIQMGVSAGLSGMSITGGFAYRGGGIFNYGTLAVTNSTLSGNSTWGWYGYGGGIYNSGMLTLTNSTLSDNSANFGGGISNSGTLTLSNVLVSGNSAHTLTGGWPLRGGYGGGIYNSVTLTVTNSTLSGNSADRGGGGIYSFGSTLTATLNNTLVAGNAAYWGPDIYCNSGSLSGSYNLIGDGSSQSSLVHSENGNQVGTSALPINPLLSRWTELDNGQWGYYLLPGSPALDAGENALAVDAAGQSLIEDIHGSPRIQNGTVDIGAVEGAREGSSAQIYLVTSLEETIAEDGVLTFLEAFEAANRNRPMGDALPGSFTELDVIQFAEGLSGTIIVDEGELIILGDLYIEGPGPALLTFDGGGKNRVFLVQAGVWASLSGVAITGGSADAGGGIRNSGTLTITNSTLSGNSATGYYYYGGGGICSSGTLTVTNSTLSGNSANSYGGGVLNSGALTVTNSTLSGNSARNSGGGIYSSGSSSTATINNTIVAENTASVGWDIRGTLSGSRNLIGDGTGQSSFVHGKNGNLVGTSASPIDPHLSDTGRLLPGSPAINAGSDALALDVNGNPLTTDLDGNPRILGGRVDIGAHEYVFPGLRGDLNADGYVGVGDLMRVCVPFDATTGKTGKMENKKTLCVFVS